MSWWVMRFDKRMREELLRKSNRPVLPIQFAAEGLRSSFEFMRLWLLGSDRCQWIDNQDNHDSLLGFYFVNDSTFSLCLVPKCFEDLKIMSSCMRALHHPVVSSIDIVIVTVSNNQMQKPDEFCPSMSACRLICITHHMEYLSWHGFIDVDFLSIFCTTPKESIHFQKNMIEYAFPSIRILGFWSWGMRPKKHWHVLWFLTLIIEACGNISIYFRCTFDMFPKSSELNRGGKQFNGIPDV